MTLTSGVTRVKQCVVDLSIDDAAVVNSVTSAKRTSCHRPKIDGQADTWPEVVLSLGSVDVASLIVGKSLGMIAVLVFGRTAFGSC